MYNEPVVTAFGNPDDPDWEGVEAVLARMGGDLTRSEFVVGKDQ